jgi:hypothetical protein
MSRKRRNKQPRLLPGVICCDSEVRGKQVDSVYVSGVSDYNVVNISFLDGTTLSVHIFPAARLKVHFDDWSSGNCRPLKSWSEITTR